jgi:hypothetical protein
MGKVVPKTEKIIEEFWVIKWPKINAIEKKHKSWKRENLIQKLFEETMTVNIRS